MNDLSIIFEEEPQQWGLRGDQYLWIELKEYYKTVIVPDTVEAFRQTFFHAFYEITGHELEPLGTFYNQKFAHGGISGGRIYCFLWYFRLLPELMERFLAYKYNPLSPRIFSSRIHYHKKTEEEKTLYNELMQKSNALSLFQMKGLTHMAEIYPLYVDFIEKIKDRNLDQVIFEIHAQMASLN